MSDLVLKVDDMNYGGWLSIRIQRGIRRFADTFDLSLTERWEGQDVNRPIKSDSPCVVEIDGETVITGYIDDVNRDYDATSHNLSVNGRSKLGDLVDCSQITRKWNADTTLDKFASDLCKPFGIKVIVNTDVGKPLKGMTLDGGESYHEFLAQLADFRAVHLTSNTDGDLVITRTSTDKITTALVLGENVLSATGSDSKRNRFNKYSVSGQGAGTNNAFGSTVSNVAGEAIDNHIRPERITYIKPGDRITLNDAKSIAEYERNIRYGESQAKTYTVNGWKHAEGLWEPNKLVHVIDPYMNLDVDWVISHVTFILDDKGERTEIEVMPPEALDLIPLPLPKSNGSIF